MVCTKTLYNYIDLGLLNVKNYDLPLKLCRNTKHSIVKKNKKYFGKRIAEHPLNIESRAEFADLSIIESLGNTKVYFTHPYSLFEKGTNERNNGLIRRFIPRGKRMSNYSIDDIGFIEEWMNTLPRKILDYKTPESLFENKLDIIYSA